MDMPAIDLKFQVTVRDAEAGVSYLVRSVRALTAQEAKLVAMTFRDALKKKPARGSVITVNSGLGLTD